MIPKYHMIPGAVLWRIRVAIAWIFLAVGFAVGAFFAAVAIYLFFWDQGYLYWQSITDSAFFVAVGIAMVITCWISGRVLSWTLFAWTIMPHFSDWEKWPAE